MPRRRDFIMLAGGAAAWPTAVRAQTTQPVRRIAWLGLGQAGPSPYADALRSGLRELGWREGDNLAISLHWATGPQDMDAAAREMLASNPEIIVTQEIMIYPALALKPAAPIVFGVSGDPVEAKFVQSLARPGGNRTGMTYLALDLVGKRLELLKEWVPQTHRVATLFRPEHPGQHFERQATEDAARKLALETAYFPMREPSELDGIFGAIVRDRCDALVVFPDAVMFWLCDRIARFAVEAHLPSVSGWARFAENGLLMTYGPNVRELYRSLAQYVDRILRGAQPAELPVQQPTAVELVINAKTAKALSLTIPPLLLARADQLIE